MNITEEMVGTLRKGTSYSVPPREIVVDPSKNPRIDYGSGEEWEAFKEAIRDYGVQQNIKVSYNEETKKFELVHGFRRMRAVNEILDELQEGESIETLKFVNVDIVEDNQEDALIGHFILNSGKALNDVEMGEALNHLKVLTHESNISELARRVGLSYQKVNNLLTFAAGASAQIKKSVLSGETAFTSGVAMVKKTKGNIKDQNRMLKEAREAVNSDGKVKIKSTSIQGLVVGRDRKSVV